MANYSINNQNSFQNITFRIPRSSSLCMCIWKINMESWINSMDQSHAPKANSSRASQEIPRFFFTKPGSSLPQSQQPTTCLFPEPSQSSPRTAISLFWRSPLMFPLIYSWVFQVVSFSQVSPPNTCVHLSSPLCVRRPSHSPWFHHSNILWILDTI